MVNEQEKSQILHFPTFVFRKTHKYSNSFSVLAHNSGCLLHFPAKFCAGNCRAVGQNWSLWACLTMDRCVAVTRLHVLTVNQWQDDRAEWRLCIRKTSTRKTDFELVACLIFHSVACRRLLPPLLSFYRTTSKIFVHPLKISKIHFSLKTPEIGKFLQRQENSWVLNASPFFLRKLRWILNIERLSPRYWSHTCDVAFRHSALPDTIESLGNHMVNFWS